MQQIKMFGNIQLRLQAIRFAIHYVIGDLARVHSQTNVLNVPTQTKLSFKIRMGQPQAAHGDILFLINGIKFSLRT